VNNNELQMNFLLNSALLKNVLSKVIFKQKEKLSSPAVYVSTTPSIAASSFLLKGLHILAVKPKSLGLAITGSSA